MKQTWLTLVFLAATVGAACSMGWNAPAQEVVMKTAPNEVTKVEVEVWQVASLTTMPIFATHKDVVVSAPRQGAIVTATSLNVRKQPTTASVVVNYLSLEDEIEVYKQRDGWYLVGLLGEKEAIGWVSGKWIQIVDSKQEDFQARLQSEPTEVREEAATESSCSPEHCWISNDTYYTPAPAHIIGNAVMYAPGIMQATANYNGLSLDGFVGGVAMASAADIGQVVWLRRDGREWEGPYLVVDVSSRGHVWTHVVIRETVVEVDFETAVRWGMASVGGQNGYTILDGGIADVEVYKGLLPPKETTQEDATVYKDFFLSIVQFGAKDIRDTRLWSKVYAEFVNYEEYILALDSLP